MPEEDLSAHIRSILGNPNAMEQIRELASSLGLQTSGEAPKKQEGPKPSGPDLSSLMGNLSNLGNLGSLGNLIGSPESSSSGKDTSAASLMAGLSQAMPLIRSLQQESDTTRLLQALRPLISSSRQKRLDEAIRILQLLRILPLLKGIF